jgi:uncharacterized membrane protein YdbT with pleckstrin-like domain
MSGYVKSLLGNDEAILFLTRKHIIVVIGALLYGIFAVIFIAAGAVYAGAMTGGLGYLLGFLTLVPLLQLSVVLVHWLNEEYIVTNRRVMKVEGFMNKHVFDSSLEKVNDVELDQSLPGRILNYGNVEIVTGSDVGVNKFIRIAAPVEFKRQMLNAKVAQGTISDFTATEQRVLSGTAPASGDIPELIAELDELRKKGIINDAEFESKKAELLKRM